MMKTPNFGYTVIYTILSPQSHHTSNYKQLPSFSSILLNATCQFNVTNKSPPNLSHAVNYDYVTWNLQEDHRITQNTSPTTCSQNTVTFNAIWLYFVCFMP